MVGDAPNLAARLQALAEPGTIVVADSTRRLLGDLFHLRDLGRRDVKGIAVPVAAWEVKGASQSESRFEAVRTQTSITLWATGAFTASEGAQVVGMKAVSHHPALSRLRP